LRTSSSTETQAGELDTARQHLIAGLSRISQFWGFPRAMGAIYGALYLSPDPLSLDDLVDQVSLSKGAVSTNVRALDRLGMVHRQVRVGERKDYYYAETDFWRIIKSILREREQSEFDLALRSVGESLAMARRARAEEPELSAFYQERLQAMQAFFNTLDNLVATVLALDQLRLGGLGKLIRERAAWPDAKETEEEQR
jgi:DNA-binding transcriptional regulator GbsR (MarR family)